MWFNTIDTTTHPPRKWGMFYLKGRSDVIAVIAKQAAYFYAAS